MKQYKSLLSATAVALVSGASLAVTLPMRANLAPSAVAPPSNEPTPTTNSSPNASPTPGDYITSPYTSLMRIVPSNIDPDSIHKPNVSGSKMPIIQPNLYFHKKHAN